MALQMNININPSLFTKDDAGKMIAVIFDNVEYRIKLTFVKESFDGPDDLGSLVYQEETPTSAPFKLWIKQDENKDFTLLVIESIDDKEHTFSIARLNEQITINPNYLPDYLKPDKELLITVNLNADNNYRYQTDLTEKLTLVEGKEYILEINGESKNYTAKIYYDDNGEPLLLFVGFGGQELSTELVATAWHPINDRLFLIAAATLNPDDMPENVTVSLYRIKDIPDDFFVTKEDETILLVDNLNLSLGE